MVDIGYIIKKTLPKQNRYNLINSHTDSNHTSAPHETLDAIGWPVSRDTRCVGPGCQYMSRDM